MMKHLLFYIGIACIGLLTACDKDKEEEKGNETSCRITQYGEANSNVYPYSISYLGDKISIRYNYNLVKVKIDGKDTVTKVLNGIDSLSYIGDFVYRIYYMNTNKEVDRYYEFENDGSKIISRREFNSGSDFASFSKEYFEYSNGNISHAMLIKYFTSNLENPVDTVHTWYKYNGSGNLTESVCVNNYEHENLYVSDSIIKEFKVYDNKKNPYYGWLFPEMQDNCLSKNNWIKYKYTQKINGVVAVTGTTELTYEYNENNYPLIGEYECEY